MLCVPPNYPASLHLRRLHDSGGNCSMRRRRTQHSTLLYFSVMIKTEIQLKITESIQLGDQLRRTRRNLIQDEQLAQRMNTESTGKQIELNICYRAMIEWMRTHTHTTNRQMPLIHQTEATYQSFTLSSIVSLPIERQMRSL